MIGHLNEKYPSARQDYSAAVVQVHAEEKPVFGFEVGQYEILPEFGKISEFQGVTRAVNLEIVRSQVEKSGIGDQWEKYIEATGELSLLAYREEVEACLRTEGMSGLSLLGLQDFPGQGTAIVGMLNSHLKTKPYDFAKPERFRAFFTAVLPLLYLPQYTYTKGEELTAEFRLANYGKTDLHKESGWRLLKGMEVVMEEHFSEKDYPQGKLSSAGEISITFTRIGRLDLEVYVGEYRNSYPLWVYPEESEELSERVLQVETLTESLVEKIENGAIVFLEPEPTKENFPNSIKGQFTTDFWSVGTFPVQPEVWNPGGSGASGFCWFSDRKPQQLSVVAHGLRPSYDPAKIPGTGHYRPGLLQPSSSYGSAFCGKTGRRCDCCKFHGTFREKTISGMPGTQKKYSDLVE